ncbi:MAG TPA: hypothetical protein VGH85_11215 [Mycobacteriales bacterium]
MAIEVSRRQLMASAGGVVLGSFALPPVSADGKTAYVANPDSDSVSVIDTTSDKVADTIAVTGDPDTLALTPDGSQLWVGQRSPASPS